MAGKGDKPRPLSISYKEYSDRYDAIFGNKTKPIHEEKENKNPCKDAPDPQGD